MTPVQQYPIKITGYPTAGGILIIIASGFCLASGVMLLFGILRFSYYYYYISRSIYLFGSVFLFFCFAIGLASGIFSIKRTHYNIAFIGAIFVIIGGCIAVLVILGIVCLILGTIGTIFIGISRREFGLKYIYQQQLQYQPVFQVPVQQQIQPRICVKCNSAIPADSVFCAYCGYNHKKESV